MTDSIEEPLKEKHQQNFLRFKHIPLHHMKLCIIRRLKSVKSVFKRTHRLYKHGSLKQCFPNPVCPQSTFNPTCCGLGSNKNEKLYTHTDMFFREKVLPMLFMYGIEKRALSGSFIFKNVYEALLQTTTSVHRLLQLWLLEMFYLLPCWNITGHHME